MSDLFQRQLEAFMDKSYAEARDWLTAGYAQDYADYRYRCGYLMAIEAIGIEIKNIRKQSTITEISDEREQPPTPYAA